MIHNHGSGSKRRSINEIKLLCFKSFRKKNYMMKLKSKEWYFSLATEISLSWKWCSTATNKYFKQLNKCQLWKRNHSAILRTTALLKKFMRICYLKTSSREVESKSETKFLSIAFPTFDTVECRSLCSVAILPIPSEIFSVRCLRSVLCTLVSCSSSPVASTARNASKE